MNKTRLERECAKLNPAEEQAMAEEFRFSNLDEISDEEIDMSDIPALGEDFFAKAILAQFTV